MITALLLICLTGLLGSAEPASQQARDATSRPTAVASSPAPDQVKPGISVADLNRLLGEKTDHQFTAQLDGAVYECVRHDFGRPYISYYYVFKDSQLMSISEPGQFFEWEEVTVQDARLGRIRVSRQKAWDAERRMLAIVRARSLTTEEYTSSLQAKLKEEKARKKDYNVLPAFILAAPVAIPAALIAAPGEAAITQRFDPQRIRLDMNPAQVEERLGRPIFIQPALTGETRVYGPTKELDTSVDPAYVPPDAAHWIAVVFREGKATRIFSRNLFNGQQLLSRRNHVE